MKRILKLHKPSRIYENLDVYDYIAFSVQYPFYYNDEGFYGIDIVKDRNFSLWHPEDADYKPPVKVIAFNSKLYTSNNGTYKEYV